MTSSGNRIITRCFHLASSDLKQAFCMQSESISIHYMHTMCFYPPTTSKWFKYFHLSTQHALTGATFEKAAGSQEKQGLPIPWHCIHFWGWDVQNDTFSPRKNRRRFGDDIFNLSLFLEDYRILIQISLQFVSSDLINNNPSLVQIMAWRRTGAKPLSEPMMALFVYMRHSVAVR